MRRIIILLVALLATISSISAKTSFQGVKKVKDVVIYRDSMYYSAFPSVVTLAGGSTDLGYSWPVLLDDHHALVVYYFNYEGSKGTRGIEGTIISC